MKLPQPRSLVVINLALEVAVQADGDMIGVSSRDFKYWDKINLPIYPRIGYNKPGKNKYEYFSF